MEKNNLSNSNSKSKPSIREGSHITTNPSPKTKPPSIPGAKPKK